MGFENDVIKLECRAQFCSSMLWLYLTAVEREAVSVPYGICRASIGISTQTALAPRCTLLVITIYKGC